MVFTLNRSRDAPQDLKKTIADAKVELENLEEAEDVASWVNGQTQARLNDAVWNGLVPSVNRVSETSSKIAAMNAKISNAAKDIITPELQKQVDATTWALNYASSLSNEVAKEADDKADAAVEAGKKELMDALGAFADRINKPLKDLISAGGSIGDSLAGSHFMDPKAPVYRWNWWHTYNNMSVQALFCCTRCPVPSSQCVSYIHHGRTPCASCRYGWFQGNSNEPFGGVHPSEWGDGNQYAHNMNSDIKYLRRLFNKPGFGDKTGATACSENFYMPHSTDDRRCGVLFRIRNRNPSTTNWKVNWSFTGWCGWGNRASVAMNKKNIWGGCCTNGCTRDEYVLPF